MGPLHDNVLVRTAALWTITIRKYGFPEFDHPSHNRDLASIDYFAFSKSKAALKVWRINSDKEVQQAEGNYFFPDIKAKFTVLKNILKWKGIK